MFINCAPAQVIIVIYSMFIATHLLTVAALSPVMNVSQPQCLFSLKSCLVVCVECSRRTGYGNAMSLVKGNWTSFWFETHFNSSEKALLVKCF